MRHLAIYARDHKLVSRLIDDLKKDKKVDFEPGHTPWSIVDILLENREIIKIMIWDTRATFRTR